MVSFLNLCQKYLFLQKKLYVFDNFFNKMLILVENFITKLEFLAFFFLFSNFDQELLFCHKLHIFADFCQKKSLLLHETLAKNKKI